MSSHERSISRRLVGGGEKSLAFPSRSPHRGVLLPGVTCAPGFLTHVRFALSGVAGRDGVGHGAIQAAPDHPPRAASDDQLDHHVPRARRRSSSLWTPYVVARRADGIGGYRRSRRVLTRSRSISGWESRWFCLEQSTNCLRCSPPECIRMRRGLLSPRTHSDAPSGICLQIPPLSLGARLEVMARGEAATSMDS